MYESGKHDFAKLFLTLWDSSGKAERGVHGENIELTVYSFSL